jgi:DNA-binding CsgD family transcriptional regulator
LDTPDEEMCRLLQIDEGLLNRHISLLQEKFDASSREDLKIAAQGIISIESP